MSTTISGTDTLSLTNTATLNVTGEKHFRRGADERPWAPGNSPGLVNINSHVMLAGTLDMELGGVLRATRVTITVVPEPTTGGISSIATAALAGLMLRRKRHAVESTP